MRRFRIDDPLKDWFSKSDQENPDLLLDDISEVPGAPAMREDDPPELNKEEGKAVNVSLPDPQAVTIIPGSTEKYRRSNFHGWTTTCSSRIAKQIANAQEHRTSLLVRNTDTTNPVYIGDSAEESVGDGFLLGAGQTIVITATCDVWATLKTTTPTDQAIVTCLAEYAWPVR